MIRGQETIKGAFLSVNKHKLPDVPDTIDDRVYYANNLSTQSRDCYSNDTSTILKKLFFSILLISTLFFLIDFFNMYGKIKSDNEIERDKCMKEYEANGCYNVTIDDGPQLNEFCTNKMKCIESHTIFLHIIVIKIIKNIFEHTFGNVGIVHIILFIVSMVFVVKHLSQ